jgi:hypothetical protein
MVLHPMPLGAAIFVGFGRGAQYKPRPSEMFEAVVYRILELEHKRLYIQ